MALQRSRAGSVGQCIVEFLPTMTPAIRSTAIRVLLSRPESTQVLLTALGNGELDRSDLALDQQQSLLSHPREEIREQAKIVFAEAGGVPSPDRVADLAADPVDTVLTTPELVHLLTAKYLDATSLLHAGRVCTLWREQLPRPPHLPLHVLPASPGHHYGKKKKGWRLRRGWLY